MNKRIAYKIVNRIEACNHAKVRHPYSTHQWFHATLRTIRDLRYGADRHMIPKMVESVTTLCRSIRELETFRDGDDDRVDALPAFQLKQIEPGFYEVDGPNGSGEF